MTARRFLTAITFTLAVVGCSGDSDDATAPSTTVAVTKSTVVVGAPDPALPAEVNAIPYKPGDLVALGNAEVTIGVPTQDDRDFRFDVTITSGALAPFTISSEMFRVYTVDGRSYLPESTPDIERFGNSTIQPGESYTGTVVVSLAGDSEPAMFVVDMSPSGERVMPGAWVFDPEFSPASPEG